MAKGRVNATRMELLRLRRRATLAKKGHKLLKDKLDGLIQQLLKVVKDQAKLSKQLEAELIDVFQKLILASAQTPTEALAAALELTQCKSGVNITIKNLMGVKIPNYEVEVSGNPIVYDFTNTPAELDQAIKAFKEILPHLIKLAEYNKTIQVVASQIIEIKRRVNALEYVLIPELEASVKFIKMKLAEMERSTTVTLMKIKEIVRAR